MICREFLSSTDKETTRSATDLTGPFFIRLSGRYARGKRPQESEDDVEHRHRRSSFLPDNQPLGTYDQRPLLEAPQEWRLP